MKYIQNFENYVKGPKNISFMALDWDDNILFLKTKIHLEKMVNGEWEPYDVSTAEFAEMRSLVNGKDFRMLDNDSKKTFGDFGDYDCFLNDTREALSAKRFGPSFRAFIKCLVDGNLFAIITARTATAKAIRAGVEVIIFEYLSPEQQDEMISNLMMYNELYGKNPESVIDNYLNWCDYFGVNSPEFKKKYGNSGDVSSPEEGKKTALKVFADKCQKLCKQIGAFAKLGFSDDDLKNVDAIKKYFNEIASEYNITFSVFDTSDPKLKGGVKTKI